MSHSASVVHALSIAGRVRAEGVAFAVTMGDDAIASGPDDDDGDGRFAVPVERCSHAATMIAARRVATIGHSDSPAQGAVASMWKERPAEGQRQDRRRRPAATTTTTSKMPTTGGLDVPTVEIEIAQPGRRRPPPHWRAPTTGQPLHVTRRAA